MAGTEQKRTRRTAEERAAEVDIKIQTLEETIVALEKKKQLAITTYDEKIAVQQQKIEAYKAQKEKILKPKSPKRQRKTKKQKMADLLKQAQKSGMKPEEIAEKLGITLVE